MLYGEALNRMLGRGSPNRLARPIGDATVMFWADSTRPVMAALDGIAHSAEAWR